MTPVLCSTLQCGAKIRQMRRLGAGMIESGRCSNHHAWVYDCLAGNQERRVTKFAIRLLTLAMFSMALIAVPLLTAAHAAGGDNPSPPATDSSKAKKKGHKRSGIDDPKFIEGYRTAYSTIYDRNDYTSA